MIKLQIDTAPISGEWGSPLRSAMNSFPRFKRDGQDPPFDAAAIVFDFEDFTEFCQEHGTQQFIGTTLDVCFSTIASSFGCDCDDQEARTLRVASVDPIHYKFLGDGALVVWKLPAAVEERAEFLIELARLIAICEAGFQDAAETLLLDHNLNAPKQIRFGAAIGQVQPIRLMGSNDLEYVGRPINLASRLQCYYRPLHYILAAKEFIPEDVMEEFRFKKLIATGIKGFSREPVIVDQPTYARLLKAPPPKNKQEHVSFWFTQP